MNRTVSILIHGLSKAGKSTLASTSPKPLLYLDVEGGTRFLNFKSMQWRPLEGPPPTCDGTWDTAVVVVQTFEEVKQAFAWLNSGQHCFESVAIDSLTELQSRFIDHQTNRQQATQNDWGEVYRQFPGLVKDFHSLTMHPTKPMSVVFVSPTKEDNTDHRFRPFVQGQSATILPYIPDILAAAKKAIFTDTETGVMTTQYQIITGPDPRYETGERVGGKVPPILVDATIPLILDYIYGAQALPATDLPPDPAALQPTAATE